MTSELKAMIDDHAPSPKPEPVKVTKVSKPVAAVDPSPINLTPVIAPAVTVAARLACARASVSMLEPSEVMALAEAINGLCDAYSVRIEDPKVAAWLGLAAVGAGILSNRRKLEPANDPEAAAAA